MREARRGIGIVGVIKMINDLRSGIFGLNYGKIVEKYLISFL